MIYKVVLQPTAKKVLRKVPHHVANKLLVWVLSVQRDGLEQVRRLSGYHDEPLRGKRSGQRSIRLSRAYRAIYMIQSDGKIEFLSVEEVHKHDY